MKYSIIIPTYNSEKTINRCLDSIINQNNYQNEIVIIDDESTDNTLNIINNYKNPNIKIITQKNSGPSVARNNGIINSNGEYIIFVDSDDYLSSDYFVTIEENLENDLDILKYNSAYYGNRVKDDIFCTPDFSTINGQEALDYLIKSKKIFACPWLFVFKRSLFLDNNLLFAKNRLHEDYGLIPCLLIKANKVKGIDYSGYNYIYNEGSLSTNQDYNCIVTRAYDMLYHFDTLKEYSKNIKDDKIRLDFINYITNNVIVKLNKLKEEDKSNYENELIRRKLI